MALADRVFETPEVADNETRSAAVHAEQLRAEGARVTERLAGIHTAVMGEWGKGGPVIAILGEYDALTAQGKSRATHKGMVHAATGRRLFEDPALLVRAKAEHREALEAEPYVCPMPKDVRPPIPMAAE